MNIVLFTPVYYSSPGTQMRVDLIKKSLELSGFKTKLIVYGDHMVRRLYNLLGDVFLTKGIFWRLIGERIAKKIVDCNPDAVIMFTDVCACAIPFLTKRKIKVILSIEDLTPEYKGYSPAEASKFYELLRDYSCEADLIITPSFALTQRLKELGIAASTVLIGVEDVISLKDALKRNRIILHAGQLDDIRKLDTIYLIASNHKVMVHNVGRFSTKLKHPNIIKYRFRSPREALEFCKKASIGLVIEYRRAYTLSRLYYHIALLQPIIGQGEGPWISELNRLDINIYPVSLLEEILDSYEKLVSSLVNIRERLKIPNIHGKLINFLQML
jgi:hypothetical protein